MFPTDKAELREFIALRQQNVDAIKLSFHTNRLILKSAKDILASMESQERREKRNARLKGWVALQQEELQVLEENSKHRYFSQDNQSFKILSNDNRKAYYQIKAEHALNPNFYLTPGKGELEGTLDLHGLSWGQVYKSVLRWLEDSVITPELSHEELIKWLLDFEERQNRSFEHCPRSLTLIFSSNYTSTKALSNDDKEALLQIEYVLKSWKIDRWNFVLQGMNGSITPFNVTNWKEAKKSVKLWLQHHGTETVEKTPEEMRDWLHALYKARQPVDFSSKRVLMFKINDVVTLLPLSSIDDKALLQIEYETKTRYDSTCYFEFYLSYDAKSWLKVDGRYWIDVEQNLHAWLEGRSLRYDTADFQIFFPEDVRQGNKNTRTEGI